MTKEEFTRICKEEGAEDERIEYWWSIKPEDFGIRWSITEKNLRAIVKVFLANNLQALPKEEVN